MSPDDSSAAPRVGRDAEPSEPAPEDSVGSLHGVGPARVARLARVGIETLFDLALWTPRRLERVGPTVSPAELDAHRGQRVRCRGVVAGVRFVRTGRGRTAVRIQLKDERGVGEAVFFNQPWMRDAVAIGEELDLYGPVGGNDRPSLQTPRRVGADDDLEPGRLIPHYPPIDGIGPGLVRELVLRATDALGPRMPEVLPEALLERLDLPALPEALVALHRPEDAHTFERARARLALEPLLALQARLHDRRRSRREGRAVTLRVSHEEREQLFAAFPFEPTEGQRRILGELLEDLERPAPMRRLLQGDVGSGKTLLGLLACAAVARAGHQAAFMAPTELLAEQHFHGQHARLAELGLRAALVTGSRSAAERRALSAAIEAGEVDVVFGTHALFSEALRFRSLAFAVIDEQHRFGVGQRRRLLGKGSDVHVLLMTATPIPRSLALTLYGDLEVSTLRERPPGRGSLQTHALPSKQIPRLMAFLDARLEQGERAYWVAPRIDDSDDGRGVESAAAWLERSKLARHGIELVHGRLSSEERAERVERFRSGAAQVLVGTTVIEVGVDVPEATVIVIEGAERLGLAQLHQLRGRVGRGAGDSHCFLHGKRSAAERISLLVGCDDGFELSEHDLARRGMGDLTGARQAGVNGEGLDEDVLDPSLLIAARDAIVEHGGVFAHYLERARRIDRD